MKEVQLVLSVTKASNWEEDGVWTVRVGLQDIGGVSQLPNGKWGYTMWNSSHTSQEDAPSRMAAVFALVYRFLGGRD